MTAGDIYYGGLKKMIGRASELLRRALDIWRTDGFATMVGNVASRARSWLFQWDEHYLYEYIIPEMKAAEFMPRIENTTVSMIRTVGEAEELAKATGYDLLRRFVGTRRRLEKGAIALCAFVNGEPASIEWAALSEEAKRTVAAMPFKVDFVNNEACTGSAVTVPKFRNKGLMAYSIYLVLEFLRERGITVSRSSTAKDNAVIQKLQAKFGAKRYAEGHRLKLLSRTVYYKETPVS